MVINDFEGKRALKFRMGNARGNDIVGAHVEVVALMRQENSISSNLTRLVDIKLIRNNSPLFKLTWTVIHTIDDESPLRDFLLNGDDSIVGFVVTLTGYDGTYSKNTYARKTYNLEDIKIDYRMSDVTSYMGDGRILINYNKFQRIEKIVEPES